MTKFLITSAIPYVNGVKHLGNLVGSLLPADVHARFRRQLGDEVLFICGTDEHGTPTELAAAAAGLPIGEFYDRQHARQAVIYQRFGLSFDHFGRSSSPHNHVLTQHFYRRLDEAGLIEERDVQQVWSPADRRFLPDRYIVGTVADFPTSIRKRFDSTAVSFAKSGGRPEGAYNGTWGPDRRWRFSDSSSAISRWPADRPIRLPPPRRSRPNSKRSSLTAGSSAASARRRYSAACSRR